MKDINNLFIKYKGVVLYIFFGGLTTLVNVVAYGASYYLAHIDNVPSTVVAWVMAVTFAYITNRKYVFSSKNSSSKSIIIEASSFFTCRLLTGAVDVVTMYISVDIMNWNNILWKILSNVLVMILNYIASKIFIFKKHDK